MKARILYPTVTQGQGIEGEGGDVVEVDDTLAAALIAAGFLEPAEGESTTKPAAKRTTTKKAS